MFCGRYWVTKTSWTLNKTLRKRVHWGFLFSLLHVLKMKLKGSGRFQNVTLLGWRSHLKNVLPENVIVTFRWRRMVHWGDVLLLKFWSWALFYFLATFKQTGRDSEEYKRLCAFEEQTFQVIVIFVIICELSYLRNYANMPSEIYFLSLNQT